MRDSLRIIHTTMSSFAQGRHLHHWVVTVVLLTLVAGCSSTGSLPTSGESPKPSTPTAITPNLLPSHHKIISRQSSPTPHAPNSHFVRAPSSLLPTPQPNPRYSSSGKEVTASAQTEAIWSKLQRGESGYVVMARHALAPGTGDPPNFQLEDCSTQRNLSAQGRAQAVRMGEAFRHRNIRVAKILSSRWCRCLETAKLMNLGSVEPFEALNSFFSAPQAESKQTAQVRRFIVDNRDTQGVIILVTHQVNITALTDFVPRSGEAVVLRANPQDRVELVGRLEGF